MDLDQYYEQIEAYLSNALSATEKADFEAQIKAQPALKRAVLNHVLANEALGLAIEDKVAGKLQKLAQKRQAEASPPPLKVWWKQPLSIAAGILFLILASLVIWANQNYSNDALTKRAYAQSTMPTTRNDTTNDPNFTNGMTFFRQQNYAKAIEALGKITVSHPLYVSAQYLLGHAYLKTSNFPQAIIAFDKVLTTSNLPKTIDVQEVEWNKLIATMNVKGADSSLFQKDLNTILNNPQHAYYGEAIELSKQLNSTWRNLTWGK